MSRDDADELLEEIARLRERLPIPHPSWHGYVAEMRQMTADLQAAVEAIRELPAAQAELVRRLEGDAEYPDEDAGGPALAAARERLREIPVPAGEHPFLDEISPTLEAAEAVLAALSSVAGGDAAFAAARSA
ncbi:MAG: hypothetical protein ACRDL2_04145 [Gaiellaceae bacterium]